MSAPTEWYRDQYLVSTSPSLIQPAAINAAYESDSIYWAKPMEEALLKKMLEKSLCFGVYELPSSTSSIAGKSGPRQVGLARLITDEVSFAYLTDVYIIEELQGKGLAKWLIECVEAHLMKWPELRRILLLTSHSSKLYEEKLGMKPFPQGVNGIRIFSRLGQGAVMKD